MKKLNQVLAVIVSAVIAVTAAPWQVYAVEAGALPEFVKTFTPPTRLGYVTDHFSGTTKQPIVLIQDLHANYKVQKKINGLLTAFKSALAVNGQPIIMGREAAWSEVDLTPLTSKPVVQRNAKTEALLKNAYISATEYFAVMSANVPTRIIGIENESDFKLHDRLTKASFLARMKLAGKVEKLRAAIENSKQHAPRDLRRVWKAEDSYVNGEIGVDELARRLHLANLDYKSTEKALLDRKLALAENAGKQADFLKNVVLADHYLSLLTRLFRQQMTMEEVSYTYQNSSPMLAVIAALLPGEDMTQWAEVLRSAVDYYGVALMRDKPLAENSMKLAAEHAEQPIVAVTGGFHTDGMTKLFRSKGISYVVIAPVVESHTLRDEMLYLARSLDIPANAAQFASDVKAATVHTKGIPPNVEGPQVAEGGPIEGTETAPGDRSGVDLMEIVSPNAPLLTIAPPLNQSRQDLKDVLDKALEVAGGLNLFNSASLANVDFVITDHRTPERTFYNAETGRFTIVIASSELEKLKALEAQHGATDPAYVSALNRFVFGAINKASTNVNRQNNGEFDTTQDALKNLFTNVPLEAIKQAYQDSHGISFSPFATSVRAIITAMESAGVNTHSEQTQWLTGHSGFIMLLVAAAMRAMTNETGITYADSARVVAQLQKAQSLVTRGVDAMRKGGATRIEGIVAQASGYFRNSNPNADQVAAMIKSGEAFGTSA